MAKKNLLQQAVKSGRISLLPNYVPGGSPRVSIAEAAKRGVPFADSGVDRPPIRSGKPKNPIATTRDHGYVKQPKKNPNRQVVVPGAAGPGILKHPRYFTDKGRTGAPIKPTSEKPVAKTPSLEQQATSLVNQIIQAQLAPVLTQQAHDRAVGQDFALAIGKMLAQSAAGESGLFSGIGSDLASAQGASQGAFDQAQQQGQSSTGADLSAIGAPQSQQSQVASGIGQDFTQNAAFANAPLSGAQGEAAAYAGNNYSYIPSAFLANAVLGDASTAYQANQARLQLEAQRPQLMQSILNDLYSRQTDAANLTLKQQAAQLAEQKAALQQWAAQQLAGYRRGELGQGAARVKISQQNANSSAARVGLQAKRDARSYQIQLKRLGLSEESLALRAASLGKKGKKARFTPLEQQNYKARAYSLAKGAFSGAPATLDASGNVKTSALPALTYQAAIREGLGAGIPLNFLVWGLNQWYKPGKRGRPGVMRNGNYTAGAVPEKPQIHVNLKG